MPMYVFECKNKKCAVIYEHLINMSEYDETGKYPSLKCPKCGSKRKDKLLTAPADIIFTNVEGTSKMDNWYYRQGHYLNKAQNQRRDAEAAAKGDANPYPHIDDISSGEHFGEVE
jgi:predicted nucleic acid-binding Zn ribbon protein